MSDIIFGQWNHKRVEVPSLNRSFVVIKWSLEFFFKRLDWKDTQRLSLLLFSIWSALMVLFTPLKLRKQAIFKLARIVMWPQCVYVYIAMLNIYLTGIQFLLFSRCNHCAGIQCIPTTAVAHSISICLRLITFFGYVIIKKFNYLCRWNNAGAAQTRMKKWPAATLPYLFNGINFITARWKQKMLSSEIEWRNKINQINVEHTFKLRVFAQTVFVDIERSSLFYCHVR